jgi:hypothetical protein
VVGLTLAPGPGSVLPPVGMPARVDVTLVDADGHDIATVTPRVDAPRIDVRIPVPEGARPHSVRVLGRDRGGKVIAVAAEPVVTSAPAPRPG